MTNADTVAALKNMVADLKPKRSRAAGPRRRGPRDAVLAPEEFEIYRPKRSLADLSRLRGAPDDIYGCYAAADGYVLVFGGRLWSTAYACANWRAGLDPRVVRCLRLSPTSRRLQASWSNCLIGRHLGRKCYWVDLPSYARAIVVEHLQRFFNSIGP